MLHSVGSSSVHESGSLGTLILTFNWLSLSATSMFWDSEMFLRALPETIVLFNYMKFESAAQTGAWTLKSVKDLNKIFIWLKGNIRFCLSMNIQEFICVSPPFSIKLFPLLYLLLMAVFPLWSIFLTSLVHNSEESSWTWPFFVIFEILTTFHMESNILFLFFLQIALQVVEHEVNLSEIHGMT